MKFKIKKTNISPIDVIKKGVFGGTYFRNIYSNVIINFIKIHGKNLKN